MRRLIFACAVLALLGVAATAAAENITVATVNVWSGLTYRGAFSVGTYEDRATRAFRFDLLADGLASLEPDVVAVQEANPLPDYANRLGEELGYDAVYDVRQGGVRIGPVGLPVNLREGEAILAPPARSVTLAAVNQLAGPGAGNVAAFQLGTGSQVLAAQLEAEGRTVYVFTTRWTPSPQASRERLVDLVDRYDESDIDGEELTRLMELAVEGSERRRSEARETVVFINELAGSEPVILAGSLYALPDSDEIQVLRDAGFVDVWSVVGRGAGYTWDPATNANVIEHGLAAGEGERARYDYVFIRGEGIVARSASVIFSRPTYGVHPS
ncbi:MAG: endonuclease/exonuclease/phosphatase family protein, partial [Spirochaetota bacterium]